MNTMTRWDPMRELDELQSRLSTLFGRAPLRKNGDKDEAMTVAEWAPLVDIVEDENEYLIKAELPEVRKEDLKVTVQDNVLTLTGDRSFEKEEKGKKSLSHRASLWQLCPQLQPSRGGGRSESQRRIQGGRVAHSAAEV